MVRLLLNSGASINHVATSKHSALHYSIHIGNYPLTQMLLANNADIKLVNNTNLLSNAAKTGRTEIVKLLISAGVDTHCAYQNPAIFHTAYQQLIVHELMKNENADLSRLMTWLQFPGLNLNTFFRCNNKFVITCAEQLILHATYVQSSALLEIVLPKMCNLDYSTRSIDEIIVKTNHDFPSPSLSNDQINWLIKQSNQILFFNNKPNISQIVPPNENTSEEKQQQFLNN